MIAEYRAFFEDNEDIESLLPYVDSANPPQVLLQELEGKRKKFLREAMQMPAIPIDDIDSYRGLVEPFLSKRGDLPNIVVSTAWALSVFAGHPESIQTAFTPRDRDLHVWNLGLYPSSNLTPGIDRVPIQDLKAVARNIQGINSLIWNVYKDGDDLKFMDIGQVMKNTSKDMFEALMLAMRKLNIPSWTREYKRERKSSGMIGSQIFDSKTFV